MKKGSKHITFFEQIPVCFNKYSKACLPIAMVPSQRTKRTKELGLTRTVPQFSAQKIGSTTEILALIFGAVLLFTVAEDT